MLTEQMTSLLTSCHIQHVCLHYISVYFIVTCHRQRSTSYQRLSRTSERAHFGRWSTFWFWIYYV